MVPGAPARLELAVDREWDGRPCDDPRAHAAVSLSAEPAGLRLGAALPHQRVPRIPAAPLGARVADLFEYDVVECFLGAEDGRYLEVELGAGGHFLVLSFRGPRQRSDDHLDLILPVAHQRDEVRWQSSTLLPWSLVPAPLSAVAAFAIAGGHFLAHTPVPGAAPDFHQPEAWPRARIERGAREPEGGAGPRP